MKKISVVLLSLALLVSLSGCTLPELVTAPPATPQVVIVVATPTPAPAPTTGAAPAAAVDSADSVEARRIAIYEQARQRGQHHHAGAAVRVLLGRVPGGGQRLRLLVG